MKIIKDKTVLENTLNRYDIRSFFSDTSLSFSLYCFEKGEFVNNTIDCSEYLSFFTEGRIEITHVRDDGSIVSVSEISSFTVLGDLEFADRLFSPHLVEAKKRSYFVVLPLKGIRTTLEQDPVFLMHMLSSVSQKFVSFSSAATVSRSLKEKLLYHMEVTRKDHTVHSVIQTCSVLQCSKRQLLRILKQLCDEDIIVKTGKGTYVLK